MRQGNANDPFHWPDGLEAVISYEWTEQSTFVLGGPQKWTFRGPSPPPSPTFARIAGVREGVIAPFWPFVTDDGFNSVWQMKWVISITLPQSESIISTTSERYSGWGLAVETFLENKSEMCLFSPFVLMSV